MNTLKRKFLLEVLNNHLYNKNIINKETRDKIRQIIREINKNGSCQIKALDL